MLGKGLAAQIELYECFWGNLVIYTPTQLVGTLTWFEMLLNGTMKPKNDQELIATQITVSREGATELV